MMWYIGLAFFGLLILVSVALHECGHMWAAQATGMKVRRYFIGFGPTLWSTRRRNKLGETEYGLKAIPAGGFCDIAGMTAIDELDPADEPYAMYRQKTWKRVAVLAAGPGMNFLLGLVLIYAMAVIWGLPNLQAMSSAMVGETSCVAPQVAEDQYGECTAASPAAQAGIKPGDTVMKVGDTEVKSFGEMVTAVRELDGPTPFVVSRDGNEFTTVVDVTKTQRWVADSEGATPEPADVGAIGVSAPEPFLQYNPATAVPATFVFTGDLAVELGKALAKIPTKVGALIDSIGGGERDPETPISVVGASIIGGDTFEHGYFEAFWFFLAQLNFVLGAINLIPLLPFDGGHIAIALFEKIRNMIRSARGMVAAAPVNYLKLMPATYVILVVVVGYMLLTVTADLVNPIRLFQ